MIENTTGMQELEPQDVHVIGMICVCAWLTVGPAWAMDVFYLKKKKAI